MMRLLAAALLAALTGCASTALQDEAAGSRGTCGPSPDFVTGVWGCYDLTEYGAVDPIIRCGGSPDYVRTDRVYVTDGTNWDLDMVTGIVTHWRFSVDSPATCTPDGGYPMPRPQDLICRESP